MNAIDNFEKLIDEIEIYRDYPIPRSCIWNGLIYAMDEIKVGTPCDELLDALGEYGLVYVGRKDITNQHDNRFVWRLSYEGKQLLSYIGFIN